MTAQKRVKKTSFKETPLNQLKIPFGIASKRFTGLGLNPRLDTSRIYHIQHNISPSDYDIERFKNVGKNKEIDEPWKLKVKTEEFSKNVLRRHPNLFKQRELIEKQLGPGTHEILSSIQIPKKTEACSTFGFSDRFSKFNKNFVPGPGTYGKYHIPAQIYYEKHGPRSQFTPVPSFEWSECKRFKTQANFKLPPGIYTPKEINGIDSLLNKVVSKRGPYDLFTGPRDLSTIKNHFSPAQFSYKTEYYDKPSTMDRLKHSSKKNYGKMSETNRFQIKSSQSDKGVPGPGYYDIDKTNFASKSKQNRFPFNQSTSNVRKEQKRTMVPGPGRYDILKSKKKKLKPTWQFLSKDIRGFKPPSPLNVF